MKASTRYFDLVRRKSVLLSLAVIVSGAATAQTCTPSPSGLVGWWPGDGNANDTVSHNNGTLLGGATFAPGKVGQAYTFNGLSSYVDIPTSTGLPTSTWTIEFWFLLHSNSMSQAFVTDFNGTGGQYVVELAPSLGNGVRIGHFQPGSPDLNTQVVPSVGVWHHLAAVQSTDAAIGTKLYLDGALIGSGGPEPSDPTIHLKFGQRGNETFFLNGLLDEVSVYNRALSATEIQAIYNAGSAGKCKGSLSITAPHDGASPQSQFVALSGTGTAGDTLYVLANGNPVGGGPVVVDSEGNWEALAYVAPFGSSVVIQVEDQTSIDFSNTITVHTLPTVVDSHGNLILGPCCTSYTRLLPLRKADVLVSANPSSVQVHLYGATYTHSALYLGGDANGTPWIAEAVEHNEAEADVFGQVRSVPLEHSLIWNGSTVMSARRPTVELAGATRSVITGWAENITKQGLPYWNNADFGLILLADGLFNASVGRLAQRFNAALNAIDALKNSTSTFICSTLVWRSYYEGTSHTLDISNPNLMSAQPGSLLANFSPAFIDQLDSVFLVPETFVRSPKLSHQIF